MKKTTIGLAAVALVATTVMITGSTAVSERTEVTTVHQVREDSQQASKESIMVTLEKKQVVMRKGNVFEPTEITVGSYVVKEGETLQDIANKLEITEEYLMSVNENYEGDEFSLEIPDADWRNLSCKVYCLTQRGNTLEQIATYFYTDVDSILDMNSDIENKNRIYPGCLIQVH